MTRLNHPALFDRMVPLQLDYRANRPIAAQAHSLAFYVPEAHTIDYSELAYRDFLRHCGVDRTKLVFGRRHSNTR